MGLGDWKQIMIFSKVGSSFNGLAQLSGVELCGIIGTVGLAQVSINRYILLPNLPLTTGNLLLHCAQIPLGGGIF